MLLLCVGVGGGGAVCVCVPGCVHVCVCLCVCACMCVYVRARCRVHLALTVTLCRQDGRTSHKERQRQGDGSSQVGQLQGDALRIQVAGLLPHAEDDAGDGPASLVVAAIETLYN